MLEEISHMEYCPESIKWCNKQYSYLFVKQIKKWMPSVCFL